MRQKLLFFISILMLSSSSILFAEEERQGEPPLPAFSFGAEAVEEQADSVEPGEQKSFFDKVKDFFGFSSDEGSVNSEAELVEDDDAPSIQAEKDVDVSGQGQAEGAASKEFESDFPPELSGVTDNRPVANHSIFSSSRAKPEDTSDLALPEGFEEFAEEKKSIEEPDVSKAQSGEELSLSASEDKILEENATEVSDKPEDAEIVPVVEASSQDGKSEPEVDLIITQNPEKELLLPIQNNDESADKKLSNKADADTQKQPEEKLVESQALPEKKIESVVSAEKPDEIKLATPNYVAEEGNKSIIDKYKTQLDIRKSTPQQIEQIADGELVIDNSQIKKFTDETAADIDSDTLQFVNNEAQVLLLPDDDVVEGKLTQEAKLNMMDLRSYVQLFWSKYDKAKRAYASYKLDKFIDEYESEHRVDYSSQDVIEALKSAFKAVDSGNTDSLISLLNAYPILQLTGPGGNNLLHEAAYVGNYPAAKLLVLKGININARNAKKQTAMTVAKRSNNKEIMVLLKSAGARKKRYINLK